MSGELIFQYSTCQPEGWLARHCFVFDSSAWIRRLCHSPFSHVDLVMPDGSLFGASDSPDSPVLAGNPRGVAIRPANYQKFGIRRQARIRCINPDAVIARAMLELGKPFDHTALKMSVFLSDRFDDRDWRDERWWFCAELWSRMGELNRLLPHAILAIKNRITPPDHLLLHQCLMLNHDTFWDPVPGLKLMDGEI